jgi:hypothetical protein
MTIASIANQSGVRYASFDSLELFLYLRQLSESLANGRAAEVESSLTEFGNNVYDVLPE